MAAEIDQKRLSSEDPLPKEGEEKEEGVLNKQDSKDERKYKGEERNITGERRRNCDRDKGDRDRNEEYDRDGNRRSSKSGDREKDRDSSRRRDRSVSRERYRERDSRRRRSNSREKRHSSRREGRERDRSRERDRERSRERDRDRDRECYLRRHRDRSAGRSSPSYNDGSPSGNRKDSEIIKDSMDTGEDRTPVESTLNDFEKAKRAAVEKARLLATQAAVAAAAKRPSLVMPTPLPASMVSGIQNQKRKLLWGAKKQEEPSANTFNQWENVVVHDQQTTDKFRKLMGLGKKGDAPTVNSNLPSSHAAAQVDLD
eukprot:Ihof_evm6s159 gene=Ihof_evmTU6s159